MRIENCTTEFLGEKSEGMLMVRVHSGAAGDVEELQTEFKWPLINGGTHPFEQSAPSGKPGVLSLKQLEDTTQKYSIFRVIDNDIYDTGDLRKQGEVGELKALWERSDNQEDK